MAKVVYLLTQQTADDIARILEGMSAQARLLGNVLEGCKRPVQSAGLGQKLPTQEVPPAPEG